MTKGTYGYIKNKKIKLAIYLLITIIIALISFFIGYFASGKSKENLGTIFAVLFVLPGAKVVVSMALVYPFKGLSNSEHEKVSKIAEHAIYDLVLTSPEKVMRIKSLVVLEDKYVLLAEPKQDKEHIASYVGKHLSNYGFEKEMEVVEDFEEFESKLDGNFVTDGEELEKLINKLTILAV